MFIIINFIVEYYNYLVITKHFYNLIHLCMNDLNLLYYLKIMQTSSVISPGAI